MKKGYRIVSSKLIHNGDELIINIDKCEVERNLNHTLLTHASAWVHGCNEEGWIFDRFNCRDKLTLEITTNNRTVMVFKYVSIFSVRSVLGVEYKIQFSMVGTDFYTKKRPWRIA